MHRAASASSAIESGVFAVLSPSPRDKDTLLKKTKRAVEILHRK
jgi:hypothetical protein